MDKFSDPESEHGGIVSGQIRDFTRRYGVLHAREGELGGLVDTSGQEWEPIDGSSITAILFGGLRRVKGSNPETGRQSPID